MKKEITLQLSDYQYRYLLESFLYGSDGKSYVDEMQGVEPTPEQSGEWMELQSELFKHAESFKVEGVFEDKNEKLFMPHAESELSQKSQGFAEVLFNEGL